MTTTPTQPLSATTPPSGSLFTPPAGPAPAPAPVQHTDFRVPPAPSYQPPSWNTAPAIVANASGVAANPSNGPWQSWDVTSLVQPWITLGYAANGGLILVGSGAPVRFASSQPAAGNDPNLAPYLDLTFMPQQTSTPVGTGLAGSQAVTPYFKDQPNQTSTFGLSGGDFVPANSCLLNAEACTIQDPSVFGDNVTRWAVDMRYPSSTLQLGYVRGGAVTLPCSWAAATSSGTWQPAYSFMQSAYNAGLIPIVVILQNSNCAYDPVNPDTDWGAMLQWFGYLMPTFYAPTFGSILNVDPPMYFELGNEQNNVFNNNSLINWLTFREWFSFGTQALQGLLDEAVPTGFPGTPPYYIPGHPKYTNYRFLTGGIIEPEPNPGCYSAQYGDSTQTLQYAISDAETGYRTNDDPTYPFSVPPVLPPHLAVASHPYSYLPPYYLNYAITHPGATADACHSFDLLIGNWNYDYFSGLHHIATEVNFNSIPTPGNQQSDTNNEGAYMMDIFTYMYNYLGADGQYGYPGGEAGYPFDLMWFNGFDGPISRNQVETIQDLGLLQRIQYGSSEIGGEKLISFQPICPDANLQQGATLTSVMLAFRPEGGTSLFGGAYCY